METNYAHMMNHSIYYFTGTGNSLWIARKLSELVGQGGNKAPEIIPIASIARVDATPSTMAQSTVGGRSSEATVRGAVGLVFPVYAWGVPPIVLRSLDSVKGAEYYYALAVNAGQVANTLVQLQRVMQSRGMELAAGFSFRMPSNYLPFGGAEPEEKQRKCFTEAVEKLQRISRVLEAQSVLPVERGPLWERILLSGINRLFAAQMPSMDKRFMVLPTCTSCGACVAVCPVGNIHLEDGKPIWHHHCEQCLACIQWCPEQAIQYGKSTVKKKRYHHPEITLEDIKGGSGFVKNSVQVSP